MFLQKRFETVRDLVVLVVVQVVHCLDLWRPGTALFARDNFHNYLPLRAILFHRLRNGELPLWNPYWYLGAPYLADPVNGVLYPPHWLFALNYDFRLMTTLIVAGHFLAAELFMYGFLRSLKLPHLAAVAGAAIYMTSGYLSMETSAHQFLYAHAWLPAFAWAVSRHFQGKTSGLPLAVAAAAMMLLAGEPQTLFLALALACPLVLWKDRGSLVKAVASAVALGLLPLVLCLGVLLPLSDFAGESARVHSNSIETAVLWSYHPYRFLELLAPNLFGRSIGDISSWAEWSEGVFPKGFYADSAYLGVAVIPLVAGFLVYAGVRRRETVFWVVVAAAGFLLALGQHLPFYRWLHELLPGWSLFRYPERLLILPSFSLPVALAIALEGYQSGRRRWAAAFLLLAGIVLALLAWGPLNGWLAAIANPQFRFTAPVLIRESALHGLAITVFVILVLAFRDAMNREQFLAIMAAVLICDTLAATRAPMMTLDTGLFREMPLAAKTLGPGTGRQGPVIHVPDKITFSSMSLMPGVLDTSSARKLRKEIFDWSMLTWEMMESGVGAIYLFSSAGGPSDNAFSYVLYRLKRELPEFDFYRLVGVGYMTSTVVGRMNESGWKPVGQPSSTGLQLYKAPHSMTPVVCPARSESLGSLDRVIERTAAGDADPAQVALFVDSHDGDLAAEGAASAERCRVTKWAPETVTIETADSLPRWMVYRRAWSKGWKAYLDGEPVEMRLAWGLFPSVRVPPGTHEVQLAYEPDKVWLGLQLGTAAWAAWTGWMVFVVWGLRRRPENQ